MRQNPVSPKKNKRQRYSIPSTKIVKGRFHKNQPRTLRVIVGEKIHLRRREKVKICSFDPGSCVSKIYWRPKSNVPLRDICYASIFQQQNNTKLCKIFFIYLNLKNFRKRNVFSNGSHDSHAFRVAESDPCVMCKGFWDSRCCQKELQSERLFLRPNQNDFGGSSTIFRHVNAGLYSTSHGHSFVSRNIWQNHFHLYCDLCA